MIEYFGGRPYTVRGSSASSGAGAGLMTAVLLFGIAPAASAQAGEADPATIEEAVEPGFCLRGGPLPRCGSFLIAEAGGAIGVATSFSGRVAANATWELGWMRNRPGNTAMGGTAVLIWHDHRLLLGGKYRYRRWLNDWLALDLAPGLVTQVDGKRRPVSVGTVAHVGLSAADWASVVLQLEALHVREVEEDRFPVSAMVGVRAGSYPAVGLSALLGLLAWLGSQYTN